MFRFSIISISALLLIACSPKFDWREVRNEDNHFQVLMPAKAATAKRDINLDGIKVTMHMTASEAENLSFSIAYIHLPEDSRDQENSKKQQLDALNAMKAGMLKNIQGQWIQDTNALKPKNTDLAVGISPQGKKMKMLARFEQKGAYLIQIVILGEEKSLNQEVAEMFFDSYKWNP